MWELVSHSTSQGPQLSMCSLTGMHSSHTGFCWQYLEIILQETSLILE